MRVKTRRALVRCLREDQNLLSVQHAILDSIEQSSSDIDQISAGDIEIPPRQFWSRCIDFLDSYSPIDEFESEMVLKFTKDVDTDPPTEMPKPADFEHGLHTGENCFYFFIKRGDRNYPVMPRRFLSVLFDTWGTNLKDYFPHYRKNSQTLRASDTNRIPPLRTRAIRQMFKTGIVYD